MTGCKMAPVWNSDREQGTTFKWECQKTTGGKLSIKDNAEGNWASQLSRAWNSTVKCKNYKISTGRQDPAQFSWLLVNRTSINLNQNYSTKLLLPAWKFLRKLPTHFLLFSLLTVGRHIVDTYCWVIARESRPRWLPCFQYNHGKGSQPGQWPACANKCPVLGLQSQDD